MQYYTKHNKEILVWLKVGGIESNKVLPLLFTEGKLGERAGGESSSELATVFMASW